MFDVILSMDVLTKYQVMIDCYKKKVEFQMPTSDKIVFRGERGSDHYSIVLALTTKRMMRKGCNSSWHMSLTLKKRGNNLIVFLW